MKTKSMLITALIISFFLIAMPNVLAEEKTIITGGYEIDYSYIGAEEGQIFTLVVTITNIGNENKTKVVFEINEDDPFNIEDDESWDIGNLGPDESSSNTFRVEIDEDVPEDEYALEFNIEDSKKDYDDEFDIEVSSNSAEPIIGDITSFPLTISPDTSDIKLEITIENLGGGDATFTRAKLVLPEGFQASSSYSDIANLGTIEAKSSKVATFYIDSLPEINSGINKAELELEYKTDNKQKTAVLTFDLPVKGKPQFDIISSTTSPAKTMQGGSGDISIKIENIGEEEGMQTSVRVFENSDLPITFNEKTNFIGNLKPGETGTASFNFKVDSNAVVKEYLIKIQTRTVNDDNVLIQEHSVPIKVYQTKQRNFAAILPIIVIVISIILLLILIWVLKKRRK